MEEIQTDELQEDQLIAAFSYSNEVKDAVKKYLSEIGSIPLLSKDEEISLAKRIAVGDEDAKKKMVEANLRLVVYVAKNYIRFSSAYEFFDLIQEGNLGLLKATENFDYQKCNRFSTYAIPMIKFYILNAINQRGNLVHISSNLKGLYNSYSRYKTAFYNKYARYPTALETQRALKIIENQYNNILNVEKNIISIRSFSDQVSDDDEKEIGETIPYFETGYEEIENNVLGTEIMHQAKDILNSYEYYIIYQLYFQSSKVSRREVSQILGLTHQAVNIVEKKALEKLRRRLSDRNIKRQNIKTNEKITPMDFRIMVILLYLKLHLSDYEYFLVYTLWYQKQTPDYIKTIYNLANDSFITDYRNIMTKYRDLFSGTQGYLIARDRLKDEYSLKNIFSLGEELTPRYTGLHKVEETISKLSLSTIEKILKRAESILSKSEIEYITSVFFESPKDVSKSDVELITAKINCKILNINQPNYLPLGILYETFQNNFDAFASKTADYLENTFFSSITGKHSSDQSNLQNQLSKYVQRLERLYYHLDDYFSDTLSLDEITEIVFDPKYNFSLEEQELIKRRYGIDRAPQTINEIACELGCDVVVVHSRLYQTLKRVRNIFYDKNRNVVISDRNIYIAFVDDPRYLMTEETRKVLRLYLCEGKTHSEISDLLQINSISRVSNIITDAIKKMDAWRYGIIDINILDPEKVNELLKVKNLADDDNESLIVKKRYIEGKMPEDVSQELGADISKIKAINRKFYLDYLNYYAKKDISISEIISEVNCHISESILNDCERLLLSLYYGIKSMYNPQEEKCSIAVIASRMNISEKKVMELKNNALTRIGARINGIISANYAVLKQDETKTLLNDKNNPLSEKERYIISNIKGIVSPAKSLPELCQEYNITVANIKRIINRAFVKLCQYRDQGLGKSWNYEKDIIPIMRYFPLFEQNILKLRYKDKMSVTQISKKYPLGINAIANLVSRLERRVTYLLRGGIKRFDFDYARSVMFNTDLPYYGNIDIIRKAYISYFGDDGNVPIPSNQLKLELGISEETSVSKYILNFMVTILKYRDGYRNQIRYTHDEIKAFYDNHQHLYSKTSKILFESSLRRLQDNKNLYGISSPINDFVVYELLKFYHEDIFSFSDPNLDINRLITEKPYDLSLSDITKIRYYYRIPLYQVLSLKERLEILQLLQPILQIYHQEKKQLKEKITDTAKQNAIDVIKNPDFNMGYSSINSIECLKYLTSTEKRNNILITTINRDAIYQALLLGYTNIDIIDDDIFLKYLFELERALILQCDRAEFIENIYHNYLLKQVSKLKYLSWNSKVFWNYLYHHMPDVKYLEDLNIAEKDIVRYRLCSNSGYYSKLKNSLKQHKLNFITSGGANRQYDRIDTVDSLEKMDIPNSQMIIAGLKKKLADAGTITSYFHTPSLGQLNSYVKENPYQIVDIRPVYSKTQPTKETSNDKLLILSK